MALMRMTTSKLAESQVSEKKIFKLHSNKIAGKNQFYTNGKFLTEKKNQSNSSQCSITFGN